MLKIENACEKSRQQFWDEIKQLGPKRKIRLIMEVYNDAGEVVCDKPSVLNEWKKRI